jgi:hypothetical protein
MEEEEKPICPVCGREMSTGKATIRLNKYCFKHLDCWFCPEHIEVKA